MISKIMKFHSEVFGNLRGQYLNGQGWFYAKEICKALEIKNVPDAVSRLANDERMTIGNTDSHSGKRGGAQKYILVNEAGVYRLVFTSRKPEAEKFKHWVFHEVLPELRRKGMYEMLREEARGEGKEARLNLTDTIKKFIGYLKERNELDRKESVWYIVFSNLVNKVVGVNDKRDNLKLLQVLKIQDCEEQLAAEIEAGMAAGKGHHDIYEACEAKLNAWRKSTE